MFYNTTNRKEVESITGAFTRADETMTTSICNKSAITDHVSAETHLIDWANVKVIDWRLDRLGRQTRKAIWIGKISNINQMMGATNSAMHGTIYLLTSQTGRQVPMMTSDWRSNVEKSMLNWLCYRIVYIRKSFAFCSRKKPHKHFIT